MRLHRPYPIFLLLWPIYWGLWLAAEGIPNIKLLLIFTAGTVLMRSAGCIINDWADQRLDGYVARTQQRPLVTGAVSNREAIILATSLCLIAFVLVLQLNIFTIILAFVALALCVVYPFMKRYTYFPQVVLGMAWYVGILMAFTATLGHIPVLGWLLYVISIIWAVIYDTMYAMADREEDKKIGIKSTAVLFGRYDRAIIGGLQSVMLILLFYVGYYASLKLAYFLSLLVVVALFIYQQRLLKNRIPALCLAAFTHNHWVGFTVFCGIFLSYF
jgi:4-hydroxybenzoate polyprenyltransferase